MDYIQGIGFIGYVIGLWAGLQKKDDRLFLGFSVAFLFFTAHHWLLNNQMAAASALLIGIRMYLNRSLNGLIIAVPFSIAACILAYFTYQDFYSLMPLTAVLVATIGTAYTKGIKLRYILMCCCLCWLIHDTAKGSYAGTVQDLTNISVYLYTIFAMKKAARKSAPLQLDCAA